jgi:hypothetical protein
MGKKCCESVGILRNELYRLSENLMPKRSNISVPQCQNLLLPPDKATLHAPGI